MINQSEKQQNAWQFTAVNVRISPSASVTFLKGSNPDPRRDI